MIRRRSAYLLLSSIRVRTVKLLPGRSRISGSGLYTVNLCRNSTTHASTDSHPGLPARSETLSRFHFKHATHNLGPILSGRIAENTEVVVHGWVDKKPRKVSKNLVFVRLRGTQGESIQLIDTNNPSLLRNLKPESAIVVSGQVTLHSKDSEQRPDISVHEIQIVNEAAIIGSQLTTGTVSKEWSPKYRYIQLRSSKLQQNLIRRAALMSQCRKVLDGLGFIEVETPLLFKSTPEGAREFLVPTRKKGLMYALPQSPQQYKQLLMASGVHRYYQIAKCFRDEDLRQDRQPEFTQLDLEMSFANGSDVRPVVEQVVGTAWRKVANAHVYILGSGGQLELTYENDRIPSMTYNEALARFGIDKPDLRFSVEISDISSFALAMKGPPDYNVLEAIVLKNALNISDNADVPALFLDKSQYNSRIPLIFPVRSGDLSKLEEGIGRLAEITSFPELTKNLHLEQGDIVAISTRQSLSYENPTPLGRFRQLAIKEYLDKGHYLRNIRTGCENVKRPEVDDIFVASWIIDFPLFNPEELISGPESSTDFPIYNYESLVSTHHPFTMVHADDYDLLESEPLLARGQHYDFVVNGVELGGGSTRIHDVNLQNYIFKNLLKITNPEKLFGHLLEAFASGCPPHAGLAIGFDRMVAMLSKTNSIRDVIAFPKTITGADPMIGSPSQVIPEQLKDYNVRVI